MAKTYDVVVVGAGVFGAWTALELEQRGAPALGAVGLGHMLTLHADISVRYIAGLTSRIAAGPIQIRSSARSTRPRGGPR